MIGRVLEADGTEATDADRAGALRWLGRIEIAEENWSTALSVYERLASDFASTQTARDAATELALLRALAASSDSSGGESTQTVSAINPPRPEKATEETAAAEPATEEEATARRTSTAGTLVGAFGRPFNEAEAAGMQVRDYFTSKGIETEFEATAGEALRGRDAVVAYLLERTRELGHSNFILVRSRWGYREFVEVQSYSPAGALLWSAKVPGSRSLREATVKPAVMERLWKKLDNYIGAPEMAAEQPGE